MLRLNQIIVNTNATLGNKKQFLLVSEKPNHPYINGVKTDSIDGLKLEILVESLGYEKINVKIPVNPTIDFPDGVPVNTYVEFQNLELKLYSRQGGFGISATADSAQVVSPKNGGENK